MTIAQIIAAKKAKQTAGTERKTIDGTERKTIDGIDYARNAMNPEWVAQGPAADPMLDAAIARIDPPSLGKRRAGLVLSASTPLAEADVAEKLHHSELRSLSRPQGESVPVLPVAADAATTAWHQATNAFESELCLMRDPTDSERGWLALRLDGQPLPLLLKSFMLFDHPQTVRSQPF